MGAHPQGQPPEPPLPPQEEAPPPFEVDYDIITLLERPRNPKRERAFVRAVREHQERHART